MKSKGFFSFEEVSGSSSNRYPHGKHPYITNSEAAEGQSRVTSPLQVVKSRLPVELLVEQRQNCFTEILAKGAPVVVTCCPLKVLLRFLSFISGNRSGEKRFSLFGRSIVHSIKSII
ncbi:hypothetical protein Anapl_14164 [Anas platyrhynchos]|uniref:Uncharacterized protein n=1 Tax=Anas platyrhynchos TaxID=8839 RepID=R0LL02_ANAPL|nr:hypothetical protein Anapl_14164 [Anas platyrhynchos]